MNPPQKSRAPRTWPGRIVSWARRDIVLILMDAGTVLVAFLLAMVFRFEGRIPPPYWNNFWMFVPPAMLGYVYLNFAFGLYGQMWRYASIREAQRLVVSASVMGAFVLAASELPDLLGEGRRVLPLSVAVTGAVLSLLGFGAVRFQSRLFGFRRRSEIPSSRRVLLVGAGDAGAKILIDIVRHPEVGLRPVGVVDDDRRKIRRTLHGVRVLGPIDSIPDLVDRLGVHEVLLTVPTATSDLIRRVAELCEAAAVSLRVLPSVREVVGGHVTVRDIRDLRIEDLLGRQLVTMDLEAVRVILRGRRVLITGAGGSIGAEITRQVLLFSPSSLVILDRDEIHLHEVLTDIEGEGDVQVVLADVRDRSRVDEVFARYRPQVVFHAAAHKHLPMLERHAGESFRTNVQGTANLAEAAAEFGAERFVFISTDKAVRASSVMGASKWLGEQVVRSLQDSACVFSAVRFGNVIGSRGGVIQTFLRQIAHGGPVTITDPEMARYFMSIEEAVQLVLQTSALAEGGEVFTLEMGEPTRIVDLAHKVIRLSGRVPGRDIAVTVTGARPGEKLVEDLIDPEEGPIRRPHPGIVVSRPPVPGRASLVRVLREFEHLAAAGRDEELARRLKDLSRSGAGLTLRPVAPGPA